MCDLCLTSEKLLAPSVVQSLSDLTMIATDEECVNSSETACFMTCKKTASSQQSQWKNYRISHSSHFKKNIVLVPKE